MLNDDGSDEDPNIPDGVVDDPEIALLDALQRCLDRPMAVRPHEAGHTLLQFAGERWPATDDPRHASNDLTWYLARVIDEFDMWEAAALWLRNPDQPERAVQQSITARHRILSDLLREFSRQIDPLIGNAKSKRASAHSSTLLWWHAQVRAGAAPDAAWMLLSLRLPSQRLGEFTFDADAATLTCLDECTTILGA